MAETTDLTRLTTFQNHIEDMRNLVMCKICLKPLYEPFMLTCGHTYCYGCLRSWFTGLDSRRRKKNCPDCRAEVKIPPSPNYILRDLVHMFISRAELLPEDETVDEHVAGKIAEADTLATDKDGKGLFQGVFRTIFHPLMHFGPFQDIADGVLRCPHCHWEIEDGLCGHCGYSIDEDEDYPDFSDEDDDGGLLTNDERSLASDDMSNGSDYNSELGLPHQLYHAHHIADNHSIGTDFYSEDYGTPNPYGPSEDEDDDEMDSFIDDHVEDEPDEVDEDDLEQPLHRHALQARARSYRIPDDDEEDEENSQEDDEDEDQDNITRYNFQPARRLHESDESEGDGSNDSEDDGQDQVTNYDESDEESRSVTPVARLVPGRRRQILISDDEDEDEDEDETVPESVTEEFSQSDVGEMDEDSSRDSDSTTTADGTVGPPQSSTYRRQRLNNHRKRRQTPDAWHNAVRERSEPSSASNERQPLRYRPSMRDAHLGRSSAQFSGRIPISR